MITISPILRDRIYKNFALKYTAIANIEPQKMVDDVVSQKKPIEQLDLLQKYLPIKNMSGKRLLEIGSGFGTFLIVARKQYQIDVYGVEPEEEQGGCYKMAAQLLSENDIDSKFLIKGVGENLPFPDNSFDIVYSTNVLEHTQNPRQVLGEAIRVCKPGGVVQIVVPNYGSFFEGHYNCFYLPYQPKWLFKLWVKFILRRSTFLVDELRTEINYFSVKNWIADCLYHKQIRVLTFGEDIFRMRMHTALFSEWGGLGKVKKWLEFIHRLKIINLATWLLVTFKAFTPLILTIEKSTEKPIR